MVSQVSRESDEPVDTPGSPTAPIALASVAACVGMGQSVVYIILPPLARTVGLTEFQSGAIISGSAVVFAILSAFWGRMIDRLGARRVLMIGLGGYAIGSAGFGVAAEASIAGVISVSAAFYALAFSRMIHAALSAGSYPAAMTAMAGITRPERRTGGMAALGAGFNVGLLVGPAICAVTAPFGLGIPLLAMAGLSVAVAIFCGYAVRLNQRENKTPIRGKVPGAAWLLILSCLQFAIISGMQQVIGFLFQDRLSISPLETVTAVGLALGVTAVCSFAIQAALSRADSLEPASLLRNGFLLVLTGLVLIAFGMTQWVASAGIVIMGVGNGLAAAGINGVASLVAGARQGALAGQLSSARAIGFIIGPIGMMAAYQSDASLPFLIGGASAVAALIICGRSKGVGSVGK